MFVSIIVPIYNSERYLKRCLESIINQTYRNIEIILIDDGSGDKSLDICREYEKNDKRIIVIHKKNGGVSSARNMGLNRARGDTVCFIDSDDYVDLNMIQIMVNTFMKNKDIDMVISGYYKFERKLKKIIVADIKKEIKQESIEKFILESCSKSYLNSPVAKMINRKLIIENKLYFDEKVSLGEDFIFNMEIFRFSKYLILIPDLLYYYLSDNSISLTRKFRENLLKEELNMYSKLKNFYIKLGKYEEYREKVSGYIAMVIRVYLSHIFLHESSRKIRLNKINELMMNNEIMKDLKSSELTGKMNKFIKWMFVKKRSLLIYYFFDIKNKSLRFRT